MATGRRRASQLGDLRKGRAGEPFGCHGEPSKAAGPGSRLGLAVMPLDGDHSVDVVAGCMPLHPVGEVVNKERYDFKGGV